jgi:small GTP-binding protein
MKRVRVVFCGESLVGKSSIIQRFATQTFSELTTTVAGAFHSAAVQNGDSLVQLELWDTAGSERYHSVIPSFFRNACAVVIVYDVTVRETFDRLRYWLEFVKVHSPDGCKVFLVGNKMDVVRNRAVSFEEARSYAISHEFSEFLETSAKTGEAIDNLFRLLANVSGNGTVEVKKNQQVIELNKTDCC